MHYLVVTLHNQRRLINVAHPRSRRRRRSQRRLDAVHQMSVGKPQSGNVTMTSRTSIQPAAKATTLLCSLSLPLSLSELAALCVDCVFVCVCVHHAGKWVNICLVFERFPFVLATLALLAVLQQQQRHLLSPLCGTLQQMASLTLTAYPFGASLSHSVSV